MIIDVLSNAGIYFAVHPLFERAFQYVAAQNLESLEPGRYEIGGDNLWAIVSDNPGLNVGEPAVKFECHNKYIDIQLCIAGMEQIGWKPRRYCVRQNGEYSEERDVLFYDDVPDMYLKLKCLQFAIFFPDDVHAPMIGEGKIKKLVVKVRV